MVNRSIPPGIRAAVLDRDGHKCSHCGSTYNLDIDHIIPVAKDGTSNIENLCTLCSFCNNSKGMGDRPQRISREEYDVRYISKVLKVLKVLSRIKGDKFTMTRDELSKALEEYPEKLREALLRRHHASLRLEEARADARVSRHVPQNDDFDQERARIATHIRKNPSEYGLSSRPSNDAVEQALLASPEYEELMSKRKEVQSNIPDTINTRETGILKAKEEKELADIEVEVLQRTLETYHILAAIMK